MNYDNSHLLFLGYDILLLNNPKNILRMKNIISLLVCGLIFSTALMAQELKDLEYVSPFHEELAAVKKGGMWAFINTDGKLIIDYRDDLVLASESQIACCTTDKSMSYPIFENGRALIKKIQEGITFYGYINSKGETVIEPDFINATHFHNNRAIIIKVSKENLGRNELLGKNVVSYSYNEEVINSDGEAVAFLRGPINLVYDKEKMQTPPKIQSHFLGPNLVSTKSEDGTWKIQTINRK